MLQGFFFILFLSTSLWGQSIVEQLDSGSSTPIASEVLTEKIRRISKSKRIFIITNQQNLFAKGDFIGIVFEKKLVARAVVAKISGENSGVKILRIHSLAQWNKMREGLDVEIIRGDYYTTKRVPEEVPISPIIETEEDLFDETKLLAEDLEELEEERNSIIKNNNVVSIFLGFMESNTTNGEVKRHIQPNVAWSYQIEEDLWLEASYGRNVINSFPAQDLSTVVNNFTGKIKYTLEAPFYSVIMPYVGYQWVGAQSPNAGVDPNSPPRTPFELQNELDDVANLEKNQAIFGVTLLKRLVPAWFIRVDLGSDILSGGLALEF